MFLHLLHSRPAGLCQPSSLDGNKPRSITYRLTAASGLKQALDIKTESEMLETIMAIELPLIHT